MSGRPALKATPENRATLHKWVDAACERKGARPLVVTFSDTRTAEQNAKLWPVLRPIARQVLWHGVKLTEDDWKVILLNALGQEMRLVPNVAGDGFVSLGQSSRVLPVAVFSDLIELAYAFGAERGVVWPAESLAA